MWKIGCTLEIPNDDGCKDGPHSSVKQRSFRRAGRRRGHGFCRTARRIDSSSFGFFGEVVSQTTCPHCGTELPAVSDAFCSECGGELDRPHPGTEGMRQILSERGERRLPPSTPGSGFAYSACAEVALFVGIVCTFLGCVLTVILFVVMLGQRQWLYLIAGPLGFFMQLAMLVVFLRMKDFRPKA